MHVHVNVSMRRLNQKMKEFSSFKKQRNVHCVFQAFDRPRPLVTASVSKSFESIEVSVYKIQGFFAQNSTAIPLRHG